MKKSRILSIMVVISLLFGLVGCGGTATETDTSQPAETSEDTAKVYTLQLAYSAAEASPAGIAAKKVKELMEAKSDGKLLVELYPNAQLGGDRELIESSQAGNIAMVTLTTAPMVNFIPELAVFDMPAVLSDKEVTRKVLQSPFRDKIDAKYEDAGFKLLMMVPDSFREMSSNIAVNSIEDFNGVKIRTMENKYHLAFWKALGANPSPLAFSELYIALQQGLVDAQENPYATIMSAKLYEQQKYIINTNHIMFLSTTIMNKGIYDGLPSEYQAIVDEVFAEVNDYAYDVGNQETEKSLKKLEEAGVEIINLPDEEYAKIQELAEPVYDMIREDIGSDLVDTLFEEIDKAKS